MDEVRIVRLHEVQEHEERPLGVARRRASPSTCFDDDVGRLVVVLDPLLLREEALTDETELVVDRELGRRLGRAEEELRLEEDVLVEALLEAEERRHVDVVGEADGRVAGALHHLGERHDRGPEGRRTCGSRGATTG